MGRTTKLSSFVLLAAIAAMVTATASVNGMPMHERKEVAGLAIVFGAEPEPALTEEMQFLRWRVSTLADEEPYGDFQDPSVVITRNARSSGPSRFAEPVASPVAIRRATYSPRRASTSPS